MIAGRDSGGVEDFRQLFGFCTQAREASGGKKLGALDQLDSEPGFVGFFKHNGDLVDEVGSGFSAKCRAIVRRHRTSAAYNLTSNRLSRWLCRQSVCEFNDASRELDRPLPEFPLVHGRNSFPHRAKSSIINHQS